MNGSLAPASNKSANRSPKGRRIAFDRLRVPDMEPVEGGCHLCGECPARGKKATLLSSSFEYNDRARRSGGSCSSNQVVMFSLAQFQPKSARILLLVLWGGLCTLIFAAPLLVSTRPTLAAIIYLFFAPICHQSPERSFFIAGHALTVCQRCTGIYLGLFLFSLVPHDSRHLLSSATHRRLLVFCSTLPMLLDVALPYLGVWTNNAVSRFVTGLVFGSLLSILLLHGIEELIDTSSRRPQRLFAPHIKGGIS